MAGSPVKRARKQGVRLDDGTVIAYPFMPHVNELPPGWRHFSTAEKIEHLIGLDRCYEILSWSSADCDPVRLSMKVQVMRIVGVIAGKALLNGRLDREIARERGREAMLKRIVASLPPCSRGTGKRGPQGAGWRKIRGCLGNCTPFFEDWGRKGN